MKTDAVFVSSHFQLHGILKYNQGHEQPTSRTNWQQHLWPENKGLAIWVAVQRRQQKANQLSEERIKKLDSIGFIWVVGKG